MVVCTMNGILSRLWESDESVRALDLSTRDDLEFHTIFPEGSVPDCRNLPKEWCTALSNNKHVRELCLYASFLDTVDENPARNSRFAVLLELFSHLHSLEELEVHAFSVPTRIFPVLPLGNLLLRQASSLRKLALYNIRSEGIHSHREGFRDRLAQVISSLTYLEELVWEPFPLLETTNNNPHLTQEDGEDQRAMDEALLSAIIGLPRLRKLSLCSKSVNTLLHPPQRLPLSLRCLEVPWKTSRLEAIYVTGYLLTSDDLRIMLGNSKRQPTSQRNLRELHLTQCLLEEPAALFDFLKENRSLRRLVLTDTIMGLRNTDYPIDDNDPYQQRDFMQQIVRILEWQNTTLHWVVTRYPARHEAEQQHTLDTLLHLNRSGLRNISLRPELQFTCPPQMWPELMHKLGRISPTVLADLLHRNFESLFVQNPTTRGDSAKLNPTSEQK